MPDEASRPTVHGALLLLLTGATLGFAWLVAPFIGAIVWGVSIAIMFAPMQARLVRLLRGRSNIAAVATLVIVVSGVILPALLIGGALLHQLSGVYARIQSGQIDIDQLFSHLVSSLPAWLGHELDRVGLSDLASVRTRLGAGLTGSLQSLISRAIGVGQGTFSFFVSLGVMLYLSFFFLRDGDAIVARIERAIPLTSSHRRYLFAKFAAVVRATIKGSLIVAVVQGATGSLVFWALGIGGPLLWGATMGLMSLLPAIGTGIVWLPVALFLIAIGELWQGITLMLCGFFVISSIDNILRPILVGRDALMPDYIVLIAVLGGLELFGFNGLILGPIIAAMFMAAWEIYSGRGFGRVRYQT